MRVSLGSDSSPMHRYHLSLLLILVALVVPPALNGQQLMHVSPDSVCTHPGLFVGPCTTVHGRLFLTNGTPNIRMWRVGTNRILGLWECSQTECGYPCPLPQELDSLLLADYTIYADFVVRPVTESKPGEMQMVCIASGTHIVTRRAYFLRGRDQ
jgi:hypothetical protein